MFFSNALDPEGSHAIWPAPPNDTSTCGTPTTAWSASKSEATLRGDHPDRPPVEVLVHVDAATLSGEEERTGISAEICRRLLCDAGIVPILNRADYDAAVACIINT